MADHDTDQARELRRARLTVVRPKHAVEMLSKAEWVTTYREPHMVRREDMPGIEESFNIMFCPACVTQEDDELVAARKLYVTYEPDPLGNFRGMATLSCKGCGWHEIVPIEAPQYLSEEDMEVVRQARHFRHRLEMGQLQNQASAMRNGLLSPDVWRNEMQRMLNDQSRIARLAQTYGAGPKILKSLVGNSSALRGQALADSIWKEYVELEKAREEARDARRYIEAAKQQDQLMMDMAAQITKKVDEDILSALRNGGPGSILPAKIAPPPKHPKGSPTAPPPPKLDEIADVDEMRRQLKQASEEAKGDQNKYWAAIDRIKAFFR